MENVVKLYTVYPRTTIKNVPDLGFIFTAGSYKLSKEAVKICLKGAAVYRRFSTDLNERVTILNLDRLHNDEYISEKDWENKSNSEKKENTIVPDEDNKSEVTDEVKPEPSKEETTVIKEETKEEEVAVESDNTISEDISNDVQNEVEDNQEIAKEEPNNVIDVLAEEEEKSESEENNNPKPKYNINYNGKKKK